MVLGSQPPPQRRWSADESLSVPPPCSEIPGEPDWKAWFQAVGREIGRLRRFLGLSQSEIARLAGVSQATVSRLEREPGRATPALVVLKVALALARQSRADRTALADGVVRFLDEIQRLAPPAPVGDVPEITRDPAVEELHRLFRTASPQARRAVIAVLRSFANSGESGPGSPA